MRRQLLMLFATTALFAAQECYEPCWNPCDWTGDFEVGGHALYWQPLHCNWTFATTSLADGIEENLTKHEAHGEYTFGFRVFAGYVGDCAFANLGYTRFTSSDSTRASRPAGAPDPEDFIVNGLATQNPVNLDNINWNSANALLKYRYQNVDLRAGSYLHRKCGCDFYVYANLHWADLDQHQRIEAEGLDENGGGVQGRWFQRAEFNGIGLGVGAGGEFRLFCGVNAFGELNLMGLIGDRKNPQLRTVEGGGQTRDTSFRSHTSIVPATAVRLGLNYALDCFGCITALFDAGWDLNYYWSVVEAVAPTSDQAGTVQNATDRLCANIGFSGLFFGARVIF